MGARARAFVLRALVAATLAAALLPPATPVHAATFTVSTTVDFPDDNPGDGRCAGVAILPGFPPTIVGGCSLRAAIMEANALTAANPSVETTINLPVGTYKLTRAGRGEDAALTGDLDVTGKVKIVGADANNAIVDGNFIDRVFQVRAGGSLNLSGLKIQNGLTDSAASEFGGGILNQGTLTMNAVIMGGNTAIGGGNIATSVGSVLTVTESIIASSTATGSGFGGGGINNGGTMTLTNVTVNGNVNDGIRTSSGAAPAALTNVTISGNSGFGILSNGQTTLVNVTITGNSGNGIQNIAAAGSVKLVNTIVANSGLNNCRNAMSSQGHNLSSDATCPFSAPGDLVNRDPKLGPLQNNGGFTFTHALLAGSPAIDAGDNNACPTPDQRGVPRPQDGDGNGSAICDIGAFELANVGVFSLSPTDATVAVGDTLTYAFTWTVPPPQTWHDLDSLQLRLVDRDGTLIWVRWDEATNAFSLADPTTGKPGPGAAPGSGSVLETDGARLLLANTSVENSGPTRPSVTLHIALVFKPPAEGRTLRVEVLASDDLGRKQGFDVAGTLRVGVGGLVIKEDDDKNKPRRLTEEQKQQHQRTDRSSLDDTRNEGNVLATRCDEEPPLAIIANRDGQVIVQLLHETKKACRSIRVGDYLEASGEKQTEQLFEAHDVTITRGGERVR